MKAHAIAYARSSPDHNADGLPGIEEQLKVARSEIADQDWDLHAAITDRGVSGSIPPRKRAGLGPVIEMLEAGDADVLVVSSLNRISRDLSIWAELVESSQQNEWGIVAVTDEFNTADEDSTFDIRTDINLFRKFRDPGLDAALDRGVRRGRPRKHSDEARRLVVDMRDAGFTLAQIADLLTREGVATPTGGRWHASTVRSILNSARLDKEAAADRIKTEVYRLEEKWPKIAEAYQGIYHKTTRPSRPVSLPPDPRTVPDAYLNIAISHILGQDTDNDYLQARIDRIKTGLAKDLVVLKEIDTKLRYYNSKLRRLQYEVGFLAPRLADMWLEADAIDADLSKVDLAKYGYPATEPRKTDGNSRVEATINDDGSLSITEWRQHPVLFLESQIKVVTNDDGSFTIRQDTTLADPLSPDVDHARVEARRQARLASYKKPKHLCPIMWQPRQFYENHRRNLPHLQNLQRRPTLHPTPPKARI